MRFRYLSEARQELDRQIEEYEKNKSGLGLEFLIEVESAISRAMDNPQAWTEIEPGIRRCLTQRFPYGILYHFLENQKEILIVAVMHNHRKPGYRKNRI